MIVYEWYKLFHLNDLTTAGLVSKKLVFDLEGKGETEFLVVAGNETSILYDGVLLPVGYLGLNPYSRAGYAVYKDANDDIWFGFEA